MPRNARTSSRTQIYHIMLRGNNRENIFVDNFDKSKIIEILGEKKKQQEYYLFAYCVMSNHIHMIIKEGNDSLARNIKRITGSYSFYFNKRYNRIGHVFQERYRSECIEDERYLLSALRYIHQNPLKPGIGTVSGYEWSSYTDYLGKSDAITDTEEVLGIFSDNKEIALKEFVRFNHEISNEKFIDMCEDKEINQSNVDNFIAEYLSKRGIGLQELKSTDYSSVKSELIKLLTDKSSLSLRRIAEILGVNRESVRKQAMSRDLSP